MTYKYLASPYTDKEPAVMLRRFRAAQDCLAWLLKRGIWAYAPIVHLHQLAIDYDLPQGFEFYRDYDYAMILGSNGIYVLCIDGWQKSVGVNAEIAFAIAKDKPVTYIEPQPNSGYVISV